MKISIFIVFFALLAWQTTAQPIVETEKSLLSLYSDIFFEPTDFINGHEYQIYFSPKLPHPMYLSMTEFRATITMNGKQFTGMKVQYDMFRDKLIYRTQHISSNGMFIFIELNETQIQDFTIFDSKNEAHFFRNLNFEDTSQTAMKAGFYEILYNGKMKLIMKHKALKETKESIDIYRYKPVAYLQKDGTWHKTKRLKHLLNIMGENSREVKKYLHTHHIIFRKITPNQYADLCKYIDSL